MSPPAKILRVLTFEACSALAPTAPDLDSSAAMRQGGLLSSIPVGDLEREVDAKLTEATADDDIADLEQWVIPNETQSEANARVVLRRFAARWWRYFQEHGSMQGPVALESDATTVRQIDEGPPEHWPRTEFHWV